MPNRKYCRALISLTILFVACFSSISCKHKTSQSGIAGTWYGEVNLTTSTPTTKQPTRMPFSMTNLEVANTSGAIYREDYKTWSLIKTDGSGLSFSLNLSQLNDIQIRIKAAAATSSGAPNNPLWVTVNGQKIFDEVFTDSDDQWHDVNWNISEELLTVGENVITLYLDSSATTQYFVKSSVFNPELNSYYEIDLSTGSPVNKVAYGSSPITHFALLELNDDGKQSYSEILRATSLVQSSSAVFNLGLEDLSMIQLSLAIKNTYTNVCELNVSVNEQPLQPQSCLGLDEFANVVFQIPQGFLITDGQNKITVTPTIPENGGELLLKSVAVIPQKIYAKDGVLNTTLYAQFGDTTTINGAQDSDGSAASHIWTRGYGVKEDVIMIPAPTFHYKPSDVLNVNLVNELSGENLAKFEEGEAQNLSEDSPVSADEVLDAAADKVRHEVNIPHNLNNTNLHVHGLHVDPAKDDVTIVIVPEGESDRGYDAPHHQNPPEGNPADDGLNEGSVADQSIKGGGWDYQYKIPSIHLPGTHWYHPHKHGSTAAQLENGMAGSMIIQETVGGSNNNSIIPPSGLANSAGSNANKLNQTTYNYDTWAESFDRIMMVQEIANYGLQKGVGNGGGNSKTVITINGDVLPVYNLQPGQLVRWRLINAGTNHGAFSQFWLGKNTGRTHGNTTVYEPAIMHHVAADGITLNMKTPVTPSTPLLMGPGNRSDVLVQFPAPTGGTDTYTFFKYYPTNISIFDPDTNTYLLDCSSSPCTGTLALNALAPSSNMYLFDATGTTNDTSHTPIAQSSENFSGFIQEWQNTNTTVTPTAISAQKNSVMPLIKVASKEVGSNELLDITFALANSGPNQFPGAGAWQPDQSGIGGGGTPPHTALFTVKVSGNTVADSPLIPNNDYLKTVSPLGSGAQPKYASTITDADILQSRPVIFDRSGVAVEVTGNSKTVDGKQVGSSGTTRVRQFTLNGRPFALNDPIGNNTVAVNDRLKQGVTNCEVTDNADDSTISVNQVNDGDQEATLDIVESLSLVNGDPTYQWSNSVNKSLTCKETTPPPANATTEVFYWVNPSYFQTINGSGTAASPYHFNDAVITPDWEDITGIATPTILNTGHADINGIKVSTLPSVNLSGTSIPIAPGLPMAQTAEEWILINNSDIGHPFHIHINPFFVTEVGQLSYEAFADSGQTGKGEGEWLIRAVSSNDTLPTKDTTTLTPSEPTIYSGTSNIASFVGKWWDTVIIPPHGYVKVRYWINVPDQTGFGITASVLDDASKQGIWVYHCHILRHEDRGMMMPVITQPTYNSPTP